MYRDNTESQYTVSQYVATNKRLYVVTISPYFQYANISQTKNVFAVQTNAFAGGNEKTYTINVICVPALRDLSVRCNLGAQTFPSLTCCFGKREFDEHF